MIETDYHIIPESQFDEIYADALELGLSVDYYLMEFCQVSSD